MLTNCKFTAFPKAPKIFTGGINPINGYPSFTLSCEVHSPLGYGGTSGLLGMSGNNPINGYPSFTPVSTNHMPLGIGGAIVFMGTSKNQVTRDIRLAKFPTDKKYGTEILYRLLLVSKMSEMLFALNPKNYNL